MNVKKITYWILGVAGIVILFGFGIWFFFLRSSASLVSTSPNTSFGTADNTTSVGVNNAASSTLNGTQTLNSLSANSNQKIFEIAQGPVVGATLMQTQNPTTTVARYIDQTDGHVYDLPLDVPGAIPQVVSNVTIPGGQRAVWVGQGSGAVMQYIDAGVVKTVYLGFPPASTTEGTLPTTIKFYPDNIVDLAASPNGQSVAYLLATANGADGYISNADGTGAQKVFSLPLSQLLISWPAPTTLLVQTKSAAGVPGIVFSVSTKTGAVIPLVYAQGLTAIADSSFSTVLYKPVNAGASASLTYAHNVKSGENIPLSFSPFPEKCIWSAIATSTMYCASPLQYVGTSYLDQWHQGLSDVADALFSFNLSTNQSSIVTVPGDTDGGVATSISEMSLSPDESYLEYVTKGDRSVWGVRLTQ